MKALREDWLPLLQRTLACLRRSRETPLQFEIDSSGIVAAVLPDAPPALANDQQHACAVLSELVEEFLGGDDVATMRIRRLPAVSLTAWVEEFYGSMRAVHASAIDILALRVEGFEPRDMAERLSLGLRQVHSILREMRASWAGVNEIR